MDSLATTATAETRSPVATVPTRVLIALLVAAALLLWLVTFDNGQITGLLDRSGQFFHELFHDGRHLIGVPCH